MRARDVVMASEHVCPGCPRIGVVEETQRAEKRAQVEHALQRFAELARVTIDEVPRAEPPLRYRTRAKLMVQGTSLGLFREGTHDVVDTVDCPVLAPAVHEVAARVRALLDDPPRDAGAVLRASDRGGALAAVDLREVVDAGVAGLRGHASVLVTFALDREVSEREARAAADAVRNGCASVASVAINLRGRGPQVLGAETRLVWGPGELRDRIAPGAPWTLATHGSFVQAHRGVAAAMHDAIVAALEGAPRVIELFAGSGALALRLASSGARVHAIEAFAPAIENAKRAADAQRIGGLSIEIGDATAALVAMAARGERADAIVLDPPRRGVPPELRAAIAALAPARVVYVACDPETLARDLAHLARLGLAARRLSPYDLMPQSAHVETIAWLEPSAPPPVRVLHEDERLIVIDKDPHEPTTPHPEHPISALARVRALPGAEHAVPVHRLDAGTSGVCLFARRPEHVEPFARALATGRKRYLALVRGVTHGKGIVRRALREEGRDLPSTTRFTRRAIVGGHSLVRAAPDEGRTHQIRRHLASIGHPLLGDARYGHAPSNRHLWERAALDRPFLHCERIELALESGPLVLESGLPADLALVLERLSRS
ncbi:pseudouridine synthase [Sandaracinus amylolyticus]|uniref:pseudouridine synthase n=1 Tax=Sandaracinus amylolyticus TaxID=927083 RepID=UPI0014702C66|nr:pseudouridine synthase [Sandaracinus amylolyticus]